MEQLAKAELKRKGFVCTDASKDTEQWVKKISDTLYSVYERPGNVMKDIDINDYTEEEIRNYISGYYDSLEELKEMYGNDSNLIIAECISEQTIND